ncbi:unnamed protein product [Peniophora sp. CBMAI 1063]|nr:unnamed protein product [Peniophora sp. CBMAI 1063]
MDNEFAFWHLDALDDDPRVIGAVMWMRYQFSSPLDIGILDEAIQAARWAVERGEDSDLSECSQLYFDLGVRLDARSDLTHSIDDLSQAMSAFEAAVDLTADDDPNQFERLNRLGASRLEYFERVGMLDDLNSAVTTFFRAFELLPEGHLDKPMLSSNLGKSLRTRFKRTGELDDINQAVSLHCCAIELTPDDHPIKLSHFSNLGNSLLARFERTGEFDDIEWAVWTHRCALELIPAGHLDEPSHFSNLGSSLLARFERTGELSDVEQAISSYYHVVMLTSDGDPDKPSHLSNLGNSFRARFQSTGYLNDIEWAISSHRRAVGLTPENHTGKPLLFSNLGNSYLTRFERTGELVDIEQGISSHRSAVEFTPENHPDKPARFSNLGNSLLARFERTGELVDIEEAISSHRRAVELTPDNHPNKPMSLSNLGGSLHRYFERTGELVDIEQAISSFRHAVELTTKNHPGKPILFTNLGSSLHTRFQHTGELDDLKQAITLQRRALELTPDGHPDRLLRLTSLGNSLGAHFARTGDLADIEEAISSHRRAVELTPDGHANKSMRFSNLGSSLSERFKRTGELDDIEQAVLSHRRAVELTPDFHPDKPSRVSNLGISLHMRFERTGELNDIEEAISSHRCALELTPDDHPDKPARFSHLGGSLLMRFERAGGELDDVEQAVSSHRCAVELTLDGHPSKLSRLNNLGISLGMHFECTGELVDIEQAISLHRRAVELTPDDHPNKSLWLRNLGNSFRSLYEFAGSGPTDCTAAIECYMEATMYTSGSPSIRLDCALRCIHLLHQNPSVSTTESLLSAHSRIIAVLPEIVWLGYDIQRRYSESSRIGELINAAVSVATAAGALMLAVEWLEAGRSLIWGQVLSLRTPLDDLNDSHPRLAASLRRVQQGLLSSARTSFAPETLTVSEIPGLTTNHAVDAHRALAIEHDGLLKQIRTCPGFEGFLLPKSFDALTASLKMLNGPVVFVNVTASRCDALILYPSGKMLLVPLPELSLERASQLRSLWVIELAHFRDRIRDSVILNQESPLDEEAQQLAHDIALARHTSLVSDDEDDATHLLERLWNWIVDPIIQSLQFAESRDYEGVLPHMTWCPTGPLTQLPLHAAGVYSDPLGPRAFNLVVSSYTPSLSALLRCLEGLPHRDTSPSVLIVTQPATPRCSPLPGTREEKRRLREVLHGAQIASSEYDHDKATVKSIQGVIDQHNWVHLACHGSQHRTDATKSAFQLYDGPLTLSDLMGTVSENAELAFLSACQTAVGDANTPEESAHLAAGMLAVGFKGVIATMWSIGDADAPIVVEAYYKELIALRNSGTLRGGETGAAYALHAATKVLREKVSEAAFMRWVPFVHFGV